MAAVRLLGLRRLPHRPGGLVRRFSLGDAPAAEVSGDGNYVMPTPLFHREVLEHLQPRPRHTYLDMTFGVGGHTSTILDHCPETAVIASDCDLASYQAAVQLSRKYPPGSIRPLRCWFSQLPEKLRDMGVTCGTLDGAIVDTGCSAFQWSDGQRGFCHLGDGRLDLRLDPDATPSPTASEVLQRISERPLWKMLQKYGGMKQKAKYATTAILEARYMFHQFETVEELREVLRSAAYNMSLGTGENQDKLTAIMLRQTVAALRMFVNDEINELHFALSVVAEYFLRPGGVLAVIVHTTPEEDLLFKVLEETVIPAQQRVGNVKLSSEEVQQTTNHPWTLLTEQSLPAAEAEATRHSSAKLFVAQRTTFRRDIGREPAG